MGTSGISGVWRSFKKRFFSTVIVSTALLRIYVGGRFSVRCYIFTKANSKLSLLET